MQQPLGLLFVLVLWLCVRCQVAPAHVLRFLSVLVLAVLVQVALVLCVHFQGVLVQVALVLEFWPIVFAGQPKPLEAFVVLRWLLHQSRAQVQARAMAQVRVAVQKWVRAVQQPQG